ncbi:MAG TPA: RsmD family RNA methyltransferase [Ignavibacteria bacterium]|nr:RsmD family RNA methyltransferase [Ignavibacteria bacterium]HMQ99892.1 RsmD family RNA methyltransferase [Ignavibacteria bacterium]
MRIIGGKFRSRKVHSYIEPKNCARGAVSGYRPTTDRARETLFNVLNNIIDFEAAECLDLFAGSGAIGFELLSRGAGSSDFVENSSKQIAGIRKTADELGCTENIRIFDENVLEFLKRPGKKFYDIIFADPPYGYEFYNDLMKEILNTGFTIFVLEHAGESAGMFSLNDFDVIRKNVGLTNFTILIKKD